MNPENLGNQRVHHFSPWVHSPLFKCNYPPAEGEPHLTAPSFTVQQFCTREDITREHRADTQTALGQPEAATPWDSRRQPSDRASCLLYQQTWRDLERRRAWASGSPSMRTPSCQRLEGSWFWDREAAKKIRAFLGGQSCCFYVRGV